MNTAAANQSKTDSEKISQQPGECLKMSGNTASGRVGAPNGRRMGPGSQRFTETDIRFFLMATRSGRGKNVRNRLRANCGGQPSQNGPREMRREARRLRPEPQRLSSP